MRFFKLGYAYYNSKDTMKSIGILNMVRASNFRDNYNSFRLIKL